MRILQQADPQVLHNVLNKARSATWENLIDKIWSTVWASVWDNVWDSVRVSVWVSVRNSGWAGVEAGVRDILLMWSCQE